jgi:hypothetical protein
MFEPGREQSGSILSLLYRIAGLMCRTKAKEKKVTRRLVSKITGRGKDTAFLFIPVQSARDA